MNAAAIEIDRVSLRLEIAAAPGRVQQLGARLRDAVAHGLQNRLPSVLALLPLDGPALLFVDRLETGIGISTASAVDDIADAFVQTLLGDLDRAATDPSVLRFADRAEYLAAFLLALADGTAWRRWWFEGFDGLRAMSTSNALRTVITSEGDDGQLALARLTDDGLQRIADRLLEADAQRILTCWRARRAAMPALSQLLAALDEESGSGPSKLLRAATRLARSHPGAALGEAITTLERLGALLAAARRGELPAREDAPARAWLVACARRLKLGELGLGDASDADCTALAGRLELAATGRSARPRDAGGNRYLTPHGGVVLLLARLAASGHWAQWHQSLLRQRSSERHALPLSGALALAVAARAAAPTGAAQLFREEALLHVAGLSAHDPEALLAQHRRMLTRILAGAESPRPPDGRWLRIGHGPARCDVLLDARRGTLQGYARSRGSRRPPACEADGEAVLWWHRHFQPAEAGATGTALELGIALHALGLLRSLGSTMPGSTGASPAYLRSQCLAMNADLALTDEQVAVGLGAPPLDVLLALSGIKRGSWRLPDGRQLVLTERGRR